MSTVASRFAAVFAVAACSCASTGLAPEKNGPDAPIVVDGPIGDHPDAPLAGGGDAPAGLLIFDPCVPEPLSGYDPVAAGLNACCDTGPAHCVPNSQIPPRLIAYLAGCPQGNAACMPDPIVRAGGRYRPASCTSSVVHAEGACLSSCIPMVANNPLTALLQQDGCGTGELCIPCLNPLDHTDTGACTLIEQLCPTGTPDAGGPPVPTCPHTGPPVIDPTTLAECSPTCGGAHCVPVTLVPPEEQPLLKSCMATGGKPGVCAPDPLIEAGGELIPPTCTSVAGAEGRCLSTCIPQVAANAALLPRDVCGADERCAPCFDPTSSDPTAPTGACTLACDKPAKPPVVLTCPWTGPAVADPSTLPACAPSCGGAHCVPGSLVPTTLQPQLATCPGGFCAPDPLIATAGNFLAKSCTSVAGAEGRCLSTCLPAIAAEAELLPKDGCGAGEVCAPCFDPTAADPTAPTGACTIGCDSAKQPPLILSCPWTGPPIVDPESFPACSPTCSGAHCVPGALVPASLVGLLQSCGDGYCAPDPFIATAGKFLPKTCASIAGAEGRCLSTCLPDVAAKASLLPQDVCATDERCVPCFDPTASDPTAPTGACTTSCDMPKQPPLVLTCPWTGPPVIDPATFPDCSPTCGGAHCVPADMIPEEERGLLATCPGGFCAPDPIIATDNHWVPPSCTSVAGAEGRCLSTCLPAIADQAELLPKSTCPSGTRCAPCYDPTSSTPTEPTGACSIGCDAPKKPPVILTCPWTGTPVIQPSSLPACAPACSGAHCLPADLVPEDQRGLLATCPGGYCAPDPIIATDNNWVPPTCVSIAGAEGRCLSTCLPSVAGQPLLERGTCGASEKCVPCYDPTAADPTAPTGACSLGCDEPAQDPVILTCPWNGPAVIDPGTLPDCAPACGGSHCLPAQYVPEDQRALLAACPGGFCTPDDIIKTDDNWVPASCRSVAGVEGRCLSTCLPSVAAQPLLPSLGCGADEKCVPCYDPTSATPDQPTGACSLACDKPAEQPVHLTCPWTGPDVIDPGLLGAACCNGSHCLPAQFVPEEERGLLASCDSPVGLGAGYCTPDKIIETDNNWVPKTCTSIAGAEGRCLSSCLPSVAGQPLLPSTGCDPGEKCVPCFDPTSANPDEPTGACSLACDAPTQPPVHLTCPWTGPDVINPALLPSCCAGSHCLPADLVPQAERALLAPCAGGYCTPDPIIRTDNNWVPASCTSIAGAEGRCLSTCLPAVAGQPLLPTAGCATNERCVPCYDPTSSNPTAPTGACNLACDAPTKPPVVLTCPWTGADVIDPSKLGAACCSGSHCLPAQYVPVAERALLSSCTSPVGLGAGYCTPDTIIKSDNNWVPASCRSIAGVEGRCLSTCLPLIASQTLLPTAGCAANERCAPCYDPTSSNPSAQTGACSLACDQPHEAPVFLTCPWTGPDVINPGILPSCAPNPSCSGAHCLPNAYVPSSVASKLYTCGSGAGAGRCAPDDLIRSAGNIDPPNCVPFAGTAATSNDGRCLSKCLPDVFNVPTLEQSSCAAGSACAPCYNPATGVNLGTCGAIGCDQPAPTNPFRFPNCCSGLGTCVPQSQLTSSQISDLGRAGCPSSVYMCAPRDQAEGQPLNYCHVSSSLWGSYDSVCVPNCVIDGGGDKCTYDPIFGVTLFCPSWVIPACGWLAGGWSCVPP